jgi:hypothetical protein
VAIKPKPRLNRAGRIYVALTGLVVLIFWLVVIRIFLPVPAGKSFFAELLEQLHNPDGRGVMVPIVVAVMMLSAMSNASSRARKGRRFIVGDGDLAVAVGQIAFEGAMQLAVAGVGEVAGDFGGGDSFGGGGATGSW